MALDIALATSSGYPDLDPDSRPLMDALRALGLAAEPRVWSAGTEAAEAGLWLVRSTWDYDSRREEFVGWARATEAEAVLVPSAEVIEWNSDKRYLADLEARGVPVVPTAWLAPGDVAEREAGRRGWRQAVVKPVVGAGSRGLKRFAAASAPAPVVGAPALLQPFLPSIEADGELSLHFCVGELTHAVRKRPRRGEFRVQPEWGGSVDREEPGEAELGVARAALAALDHVPLVARADLVKGSGGQPLLIELELIEPNLFLCSAPDAAAHFAAAVAQRLATSAASTGGGP